MNCKQSISGNIKNEIGTITCAGKKYLRSILHLQAHEQFECLFTLNVQVTIHSGFPLVLEKLQKMERYFPVRKKPPKFEQTGKVEENHTKYWKSQGISL